MNLLSHYEILESDIIKITGFDIETLRKLFAAGYTLTAPTVNEGWIPVETDLPAIGRRVEVICTNTQNQMQAYVAIATLHAVRNGQGIWSGHRHVTHWKALPTIPLSALGV